MGASLYYRPVDPSAAKQFANGSTLHGNMVRAFGEFPIQLSSQHIPVLRGLMHCGYSDLQELIDAIEVHGVVEITVDY